MKSGPSHATYIRAILSPLPDFLLASVTGVADEEGALLSWLQSLPPLSGASYDDEVKCFALVSAIRVPGLSC